MPTFYSLQAFVADRPPARHPRILRLTRLVELLGGPPELRKLAEWKAPNTDP